MDSKERGIREEVRQFLLQLAMELETSAGAARKAAELSLKSDMETAWPYVQQMYTRLSQANLQLQSLKALVDYAVKQENADQNKIGKK